MDQGATLAEQLIEAARRNNLELLDQVLDTLTGSETAGSAPSAPPPAPPPGPPSAPPPGTPPVPPTGTPPVPPAGTPPPPPPAATPPVPPANSHDELSPTQRDVANLLNSAKDPLGNGILHIACSQGFFEIVDRVLDQPGVEMDPVNLLQGDTPLHCLARYSIEEPEHGAFLVEELIEAGADPRVRNKHKQKPIDLVPEANTELRDLLQGAEFALLYGPKPTAAPPAAPEQDDGPSDSE